MSWSEPAVSLYSQHVLRCTGGIDQRCSHTDISWKEGLFLREHVTVLLFESTCILLTSTAGFRTTLVKCFSDWASTTARHRPVASSPMEGHMWHYYFILQNWIRDWSKVYLFSLLRLMSKRDRIEKKHKAQIIKNKEQRTKYKVQSINHNVRRYSWYLLKCFFHVMSTSRSIIFIFSLNVGLDLFLRLHYQQYLRYGAQDGRVESQSWLI